MRKQKTFRCRMFMVRGRNSLFIGFKKGFWKGIEKPYRVYFYVDEKHLHIALRCPEYLPMYRVYPRWLQYAGRNSNSRRAVIPRRLVKANNLTRFDFVELHRFKFKNGGASHQCRFIKE